MPSILPQFEYDIFVSYRQNDNRSDGWVTKFVADFKKELEATIKQPVNVYFDENPHDGLQELHHVDDSLAHKLKCILFMPIVSQTYCDPTSFAWKHEFMPFLSMAGSDSLGKKITLQNGNVSTRVLPIQIHKIENLDQKLIEEKMEGPLRSIEFIYSERGVNRPLIPSDGDGNLNKTLYRNQLNKAANAVKEVMAGVVDESSERETSDSHPTSSNTPPTTPSGSQRHLKRWWIAVLAFLAIAYFGYMFMNANKQVDIPEGEKSIAVLPFTNLNEGSEYNQICNGLSDDISNLLSKLDILKVISSKSSYAYQNTSKTLKVISDELGAQYIMDGSIQARDGKLRISVRLNDAINDKVIWAESYNREMVDVFALQSEVSQDVINSLRLNLDDSQTQRMKVVNEFDLQAYELYKVGEQNYYRDEIYKTPTTTVPYFKQAIALDPTIYPAYVALANAYMVSNSYGQIPILKYYDEIDSLLRKAKSLNPEYPPLWAIYAKFAIELKQDETAYAAHIAKALEMDPNNPEIYYLQAQYYNLKEDYQKSDIAINKGIELDPGNIKFYLSFKGFYDYFQRDYEAALRAEDEVLKLDPTHDNALWMRSMTLTQLGRYEEAIEVFGKRSMAAKTNWGLTNAHVGLGNIEAARNILNFQLEKAKIQYVPKAVIGHIYLALGNKEEACNYFKQHLESGDGGVVWLAFLRSDPRMDALKDDPCYEEIKALMPF